MKNIEFKECTEIGYPGLYASTDSRVWYKDKDDKFVEIIPYLNICKRKTSNWKFGYYKFHYAGRIINLHRVLALAFVPGYKPGLIVDHIDNNSTNNSIDNLQWLTRKENIEKFWDSLTEKEKEEHKIKYANGVKKGHAKGNYKKHLENLHKGE